MPNREYHSILIRGFEYESISSSAQHSFLIKLPCYHFKNVTLDNMENESGIWPESLLPSKTSVESNDEKKIEKANWMERLLEIRTHWKNK